MIKNFSNKYFNDVASIAKRIDFKEIEKLVFTLIKIKKKKGRIFFIGVGGSAGNCSHAVNDFRKLANIECYTPTDNSSELIFSGSAIMTSFSELKCIVLP